MIQNFKASRPNVTKLPTLSLRRLLFVFTENIIYKKIGDEVVLEPGSVSEPIKSLTWKVDVNLAMMWDGKEVDSFRQFKGIWSLFSDVCWFYGAVFTCLILKSNLICGCLKSVEA